MSFYKLFLYLRRLQSFAAVKLYRGTIITNKIMLSFQSRRKVGKRSVLTLESQVIVPTLLCA